MVISEPMRVFDISILVVGILLYLLLFVYLSLPATIIRIRVQASFLPVEEKTIVPYDRTTSGTIIGIRNVIYILPGNWRTFQQSSDRKRWLKLNARMYIIGPSITGLWAFIWRRAGVESKRES
ncbi:hypothetical protein V1515DRAFT_605916 [Lipomyces mesembrius]